MGVCRLPLILCTAILSDSDRQTPSGAAKLLCVWTSRWISATPWPLNNPGTGEAPAVRVGDFLLLRRFLEHHLVGVVKSAVEQLMPVVVVGPYAFPSETVAQAVSTVLLVASGRFPS